MEDIKRFGQLYDEDDEPMYCVPESLIGAAVDAEIESFEVGQTMSIKIIEMTQEQFDTAPEYEG